MPVIRKCCGSRKIIIFLHIHIMCCGLIYTNIKNTPSAGAWQEFYVCSKVVTAKIFINGLKRWQKVELRTLANSFKLALRCRLLLYALFSVFLIQVSGVHWTNARSLMSVTKTDDEETVSNLERFQNFAYSKNIDIIFVNETWFSVSIDNGEILLSRYTIVRNDRDGRGAEFFWELKQGYQICARN